MDTPFPAYKGDDAFVFVCYAHADNAVVYPEIEWLHGQGVNLWYDEGISAGKVWRGEIAEALEGARRVLFYISKASLESDHCRREIHYALDKSFEIVPVYLEDVELSGDLQIGLNLVQALYRERDASYQQHVLNALGQSTTSVEPQPRVVHEGPRRRFPARVGLVFALVLLIGAAWWFWPRANEVQAPAEAMNNIAAVAVTELPATSIAVLPFVNMSNDPDQEFFSDGITEDILNELARNTSLTVRPRTSSFALKGASIDLRAIGQKLDVTHVLEGSVRRSGERMRVTVQLSEVSSNRSVWSERYERELTNIFEVQDAITREVLGALNAQLVVRTAPRTFVDSEAYEAFLLGRYHLNQFDVEEADRWLKIAIDLDPDNADAWAQFGYLKGIMIGSGFPGEHRQERGECIYRALAIDPTNPIALALQALDTFIVDRDYQASIDQLVGLVRASPNNVVAHLNLQIVLRSIGRHTLALRTGLRAVELDPLSLNTLANHALTLVSSGAVEEGRQVFDGYELHYPAVDFEIAWAEGDLDAMQTALYELPASSFWYPLYSALVPYMQGDQAAVQPIVQAILDSPNPSHWVQSHVAIIEGRFDSALDHWREAVRAGEFRAVTGMKGRYAWRKTFPEFYDHPDFQRMLVDFEFDAESRSKITVPELPF